MHSESCPKYPKIRSLHIFVISPEKRGHEVNFLPSKYPKIRSLHIFVISPEKRGHEVNFLPSDKHQMFPQIDTIVLCVYGQACPD